jgi:hypothetical protein
MPNTAKLLDLKLKLEHLNSGASIHKVAQLRQKIALALAYHQRHGHMRENVLNILTECLALLGAGR